jgi:hypothetical protein
LLAIEKQHASENSTPDIHGESLLSHSSDRCALVKETQSIRTNILKVKCSHKCHALPVSWLLTKTNKNKQKHLKLVTIE